VANCFFREEFGGERLADDGDGDGVDARLAQDSICISNITSQIISA
jgi:hypothetical protein